MEKRSTGIWYDVLAVTIVAFWGLTFISTMKLLRYYHLPRYS